MKNGCWMKLKIKPIDDFYLNFDLILGKRGILRKTFRISQKQILF